jgi:beta-lysine 5,6-aminomutase alpha subunit
MSDRAIAIDIAQYIFNNMDAISEELLFKPDGIINQQANNSLSKAHQLLTEIELQGLFKTLELGIFAGIKRPINGGKGLEGVFKREKEYFNPFESIFLNKEEMF